MIPAGFVALLCSTIGPENANASDKGLALVLSRGVTVDRGSVHNSYGRREGAVLQENRGLGLYNYLICKTFSYSAKEFSEAASFKVY